jgi:hypothetical protein
MKTRNRGKVDQVRRFVRRRAAEAAHAGRRTQRRQQQDLVPGLALQPALDHAVGAQRARREPGEREARQARPGALEGRGLRRRHPAAAPRRRALAQRPELPQLARQRPQHQRRLDALAAQPSRRAARAAHRRRAPPRRGGKRRSASCRRLRRARAVARAGSPSSEQAQLVDLLLAGEQVALDARGEQLHGRIVEHESRALAAFAQP